MISLALILHLEKRRALYVKQKLLDLKLKFQKYSDRYTPDIVPIVQCCPTLIYNITL